MIKTITATTAEVELTLDTIYKFVWFRNLGATDCYVSENSGIVPDADDVALLKAGETRMLELCQTSTCNKVYIKASSDADKVEYSAQNFAECPFKVMVKGGGGSGGSANIYRTTTALTDGSTTNPITVDEEQVTAVSGDFAIYNTQEFIFDGNQWNLLGDRVGLGDLAYKSSASGTAVTNVVYDSVNERLVIELGTVTVS